KGNTANGIGGGLRTNGNVERITGCKFLGNTAARSGGAMYIGTAIDCLFEGNRALEGCGGAGYDLAAAIGCTALGNSADYGGGFADCGEITNCVVSSNSAANYGGGTYNCRTVTGGTEVRGNRAGREGSWAYGGGIYGASLVSNCVVSENVATGYNGYGGGIARGNGDLMIADCEISGNTAEGEEYSAGGGVYGSSWDNTAQAWRCTISGNTAVSRGNYNGGDGGGTYGTVLYQCRVTDNVARGNGYAHGGGAYGQLALECDFTGNRAEASFRGGNAYGGAAYGADLHTCTVSNNEARVGGGLSGGSAMDTLFTHNRASQSGGGTSGTTMTNCIVAHNRAPVDGGSASIAGWNNTVTLNESERQETLLVWGASNLLVWGETVGGRMQPVVTGMTTSTQQTPGSVYIGYDPDTWQSLYGTPVREAKPLPMADPWNGDYRLLAGSEAIDAGTYGWDGTLYYDMKNGLRVRGSAPDVGAL
ncbi:MAG: hypothetical protein J6Y19_10680, partial [Kiritimatiellae bacterium]|nr:hypothetical protein [Kiritimatiellia bacterium]